jgi:hypothetical protein
VKQAILALGLAILIVGAWYIAGVRFSAADMCSNEALDISPSPNGDLEAVVFERACGATTGYGINVSILPAGSKANDAGNVFVAAADRSSQESRNIHRQVRVRWLAPDSLHVERPPGMTLFHEASQLGDVRVTYATMAGPPNDRR